jgi:hypothetical protein
MSSGSLTDAFKALATNDTASIIAGLSEIERQLPTIAGDQLADVVGAVNTIFYCDTYEYPQLQPVVDRAVRTLSLAGERVIPHLLRLLGDSDYKVEFHYALIFGLIGAPAIVPLLEAYDTARDAPERSFIIYSLGKIKSPEVKRAIGTVLNGLGSPSKEVRDSAARTLGKIVENVLPPEVEPQRRAQMFERLTAALRDSHSGVRAKACRSLGKMAKREYLDPRQTSILAAEIVRLLGKGSEKWDDAFAVRKEALEVEGILAIPR